MNTASKVKKMCYVSLATAIICVLGPLAINIPVSPVPISLAIFGIYIAAYVLGAKLGTVACILYIITGLTGVPVFASYTGGPQKLLGPTGGYIIGYIAVAFVSGLFIDAFPDKILMHLTGMLIGVTICYAIGTLWLSLSAGMSLNAALMAGVIPFIPMDIVKMVIAAAAGIPIRRALARAVAVNAG